jgi:hypothetical protein
VARPAGTKVQPQLASSTKAALQHALARPAGIKAQPQLVSSTKAVLQHALASGGCRASQTPTTKRAALAKPAGPTSTSRSTSPTPCKLGKLKFTHSHGECGSPESCAECVIFRRVQLGQLERECKLSQKNLNEAGYNSWLCTRVLTSAGCELWGAGCIACRTVYVLADQAGHSAASTLLKRLGNVGRGSRREKTTAFARCTLRECSHFSSKNLSRHATSPSHVYALAVLDGTTKALLRSGEFKSGAPSKDKYDAVIRAIRKGDSRTFIPRVGDEKKIRKLRWTIAEAIRDTKRTFVSSCATMAVHQDKMGKNSKLAMMFTASNAKLAQASGILGLAESSGPHLCILESTVKMWKQFWTRGHGAPGVPASRHTFDSANSDASRNRVHFMAADAAGDAALALERMGKPVAVVEALGGGAVFPNKKIGEWDRAHGARRIASRPKEDYVNETIRTIISQKGSIIRVIHASPEFRTLYKNHKTRLSARVGKRAINLRFSSHRYDSMSKPQGRTVLSILAVIKTADTIRRIRKNTPEGQTAEAFLEFIGNERLVTLGMSADYGDEIVVIVRHCDTTEGQLTEETANNVNMGMVRLHVLFIDGECVKSGYTKFILDTLAEPTQIFVGGKPKIIGNGVAPAVVQRCMRRFQCLVRQSRAVCEAEFPNFSILTSFAAFSLGDNRSTAFEATVREVYGVMQSTPIEEHIERFSKLFHLDKDHHVVIKTYLPSHVGWRVDGRASSPRK